MKIDTSKRSVNWLGWFTWLALGSGFDRNRGSSSNDDDSGGNIGSKCIVLVNRGWVPKGFQD